MVLYIEEVYMERRIFIEGSNINEREEEWRIDGGEGRGSMGKERERERLRNWEKNGLV